jgi:hypothetical protein
MVLATYHTQRCYKTRCPVFENGADARTLARRTVEELFLSPKKGNSVLTMVLATYLTSIRRSYNAHDRDAFVAIAGKIQVQPVKIKSHKSGNSVFIRVSGEWACVFPHDVKNKNINLPFRVFRRAFHRNGNSRF